MARVCSSAVLIAFLIVGADSPGTLSVASEPAGAAVYVDGQYVGRTPTDVKNLLPGDHRIRLVKDGFLENGRIVNVAAGKTATLQVRLTARSESDALPQGQPGGGISSGGGGGGISKKWIWIGAAAGGGAALTAWLLRSHIDSIAASPATGLQSSTSIAFTATGVSSDASLMWDFGDGSTSTERNPTHIYRTSGTFTAKCTVSGSSATTTVTVKSLTGTWRGNVPGTTPVVGTLVLTQTDTAISGTFSDPVFGPGTITGQSQVRTTSPRVTIQIRQTGFDPFTFTGEPSGDVNTIVGVLNQSGFNNDPLTITRQ